MVQPAPPPAIPRISATVFLKTVEVGPEPRRGGSGVTPGENSNGGSGENHSGADNHHEGYISWAEFERNQQLIADNANGKRFLSRGAVRPGEALLPGLLRCARCGKKLRVRYGQTHRYECVR